MTAITNPRQRVRDELAHRNWSYGDLERAAREEMKEPVRDSTISGWVANPRRKLSRRLSDTIRHGFGWEDDWVTNPPPLPVRPEAVGQLTEIARDIAALRAELEGWVSIASGERKKLAVVLGDILVLLGSDKCPPRSNPAPPKKAARPRKPRQTPGATVPT